MRKIEGGVVHLANQIDEELWVRGLRVSVPQRRALSDISASILSCQSVNTTEIANILPRNTDEESRYRYINRVLKNEHISSIDVMSPLAQEAIELATENGVQMNKGTKTAIRLINVALRWFVIKQPNISFRNEGFCKTFRNTGISRVLGFQKPISQSNLNVMPF